MIRNLTRALPILLLHLLTACGGTVEMRQPATPASDDVPRATVAALTSENARLGTQVAVSGAATLSTATLVSSTATSVPPTATAVAPTATTVPPTATHLATTGSIKGRAYRPTENQPIAGRDMLLFIAKRDSVEGPTARVLLDDQGRYEFSGINPGQFRLALDSWGFEQCPAGKVLSGPWSFQVFMSQGRILEILINSSSEEIIVVAAGKASDKDFVVDCK